MCFSSTVSLEYSYKHHYLTYTKVLLVLCLYETVRLSVLLANFPLHIYFILCNHLVLNERETLLEFSTDEQC